MLCFSTQRAQRHRADPVDSIGGTSLRVRAWPPRQIGVTSRMRPHGCSRSSSHRTRPISCDRLRPTQIGWRKKRPDSERTTEYSKYTEQQSRNQRGASFGKRIGVKRISVLIGCSYSLAPEFVCQILDSFGKASSHNSNFSDCGTEQEGASENRESRVMLPDPTLHPKSAPTDCCFFSVSFEYSVVGKVSGSDPTQTADLMERGAMLGPPEGMSQDQPHQSQASHLTNHQHHISVPRLSVPPKSYSSAPISLPDLAAALLCVLRALCVEKNRSPMLCDLCALCGSAPPLPATSIWEHIPLPDIPVSRQTRLSQSPTDRIPTRQIQSGLPATGSDAG